MIATNISIDVPVPGICLPLLIAALVLSAAVIPIEANEASSPQGQVVVSEGKDDFFLATLHCQLVCDGGSTTNTAVTRGFDASSHGLLPGDGSGGKGSPWGSLTSTLEAWSQLVCLETAVEKCGGLEKVDQSDLKRITSGSWVLDRRVICPDVQEAEMVDQNDREPRIVFPDHVPVLSPYSTGSGAIRSGNDDSESEVALPLPGVGAVLTGPEHQPTLRRVDTFEYWMNRAVTFREVPDHLNSDAEIRRALLEKSAVQSEEEYVARIKSLNGIEPALPCAVVIRGRACYGDCLEFPEGREREEYLATNKIGPENVGSIAVCGDQLAAFFVDHAMSIDAKKVYCEKYLMDSLLAGRTTAFTCSSYRFRADCSSLF